MTIKTTFIASAPFEAARSVSILPENHRSRKLHGHSFLATIQCSMPAGIAPYPGGELEVMKSRLALQIAKLDYSDLNKIVETPTDENLARWVNSHCYVPSTQKIGVQSTADSGVEIDTHGKAHVWRRYVFQSIRRLKNLPEGHVCGAEHSHSFTVIVHVDHEIGERDISVDYDFIDERWAHVSKDLNFVNLNSVSGLGEPSTENLAKWVWTQLKKEVQDVSRVTIYEAPFCGVTFNGINFHVWNESSFSCGVLRRTVSSISQSELVTSHQSFSVRIYVSQPSIEDSNLMAATGGAKECLDTALALIDSKMVAQLPEFLDSSTKCIAMWIHKQLAQQIPNVERVELFETRGCGVIVSSGFAETVIPV